MTWFPLDCTGISFRDREQLIEHLRDYGMRVFHHNLRKICVLADSADLVRKIVCESRIGAVVGPALQS